MNAENPSRRWLSMERGTIVKDWGGRIPIALIFPNTYYVGMSSLGFQAIYGILNSYSDIVCERIFTDGAGKSVESDRPIDDFAVLAFSISDEMDYFNAVGILDENRIPLQSADRDETHPLIIAGGPCITANPEPLAPLFDCFAIGEGEAILPQLIEKVTEAIHGGRDHLLEAVSDVPGIYVPQLSGGVSINRQWARNIDDFDTETIINTPDTELGDLHLIEIARGCPWGCRFCLAGYLFRPFRHRSVQHIVEQSQNALNRTNRIGLLGACISDHPEIDELVSQLAGLGARISVSSLRVRPISEALLQALKSSGTDTVTLAPEAGSERLRRIINKGISKNDIIAAVDKASDAGMRRIKMYFMIGLPSETEQDIEELIELALELKMLTERKRSGSHLIVNIEPFVPKAGTPFQRLPMAGGNTLRRRLARIRRGLERRNIEVRSESVTWATVQGVLSRGDSRLAPVLCRMARKRTMSEWRNALEENSLETGFYTGRSIPPDERLPWSYIDAGVKTEYLESEMERASNERTTPPCPTLECHRCGVC